MSQLWKRLFNYTLNGSTRIPKGDSLTAESGSTVNIAGTFKIGGTAVTPDANELNILDGVTATADEINRITDESGRIVTSTATALSLTVTQHGGRVVLVNTNSTVANTFTLPAATGSGCKFTVINGIAQTQGSVVVAANGTDVMKGIAKMVNTTVTNNAEGFLTSASSDKVTFNRTTTGGAGYDMVEAWDIAANTWEVRVEGFTGGSVATPFSET